MTVSCSRSLPVRRLFEFGRRPDWCAAPILALFCLGFVFATNLAGQAWSVTEFQYQGGRSLTSHFVNPTGFQHIFTLQHASGWKYGENFFFVDMKCCEGSDANRDMYLEWYPFFDLGSLTGSKLSFGPVKTVGPLGGLNWGAQAKVLRLGPGLRFQLDLPGFAFANLDYLYLVNQDRGLAAGGVPKDSSSHLVDFNWALPIKVGDWTFSLEGHAERNGARMNELGLRLPAWYLLQPQLRLDLGEALAGRPGRFFAGIEFHVWINKFGFEEADEVLPQLLLVYRF